MRYVIGGLDILLFSHTDPDRKILRNQERMKVKKLDNRNLNK